MLQESGHNPITEIGVTEEPKSEVCKNLAKIYNLWSGEEPEIELIVLQRHDKQQEQLTPESLDILTTQRFARYNENVAPWQHYAVKKACLTIVNSSSTVRPEESYVADGLVRMLEFPAGSDPRIAALEHAKGKIAVLVYADTQLDPRWLAKLSELMAKRTNRETPPQKGTKPQLPHKWDEAVGLQDNSPFLATQGKAKQKLLTGQWKLEDKSLDIQGKPSAQTILSTEYCKPLEKAHQEQTLAKPWYRNLFASRVYHSRTRTRCTTATL